MYDMDNWMICVFCFHAYRMSIDTTCTHCTSPLHHLLPSDTFHTAIRFIDYCHNCGNEKRVQDRLNAQHYPSADSRSIENKDSVSHFQDILPDLNGIISTNLEHAVNDEYRFKSGHCLASKTFGVSAVMEVSTPAQASQC